MITTKEVISDVHWVDLNHSKWVSTIIKNLFAMKDSCKVYIVLPPVEAMAALANPKIEEVSVLGSTVKSNIAVTS